MEKFLLSDIQVKKSEKNNKNWWNNLSSHIFPQNISDQINNLKYLKLFPLFVSFYLNVENKKKMLANKSKENKLKKPMAGFSDIKYISIFGKPLWFAYWDPDKLKKVAK